MSTTLAAPGHLRAGRPTRVGLIIATVVAVLAALVMPAVSTASARAAEATHGLRGDYFTITNTSTWELADANLALSVLDEDIDVNDLVPVYAAMTGRTERTGVRWTGSVTAPTTGDYTFSAIGDNGFRLWVGGSTDADKLIDFWVDKWDLEQTATRTVHLEAGVPVPIRFDLFQNTGGANIHLRWASADAGIAKTAVPGSAFTPPSDFHPYDVTAAMPAAGDSVVLTMPGDVSGAQASADHLRVIVDGDTYPVTSITESGPTVTLALDEKVLAGAYVRVAYDGQGTLAAGGEAAPKFNVLADNASTHELTTPWAADVDPDNPLPEYPRPQLERTTWQNLNGRWDFTGLDAADSPLPASFDEKVVVPFPIESSLSGIKRHEDHMAYRRTFTVPAKWGVAVPGTPGSNKARLKLNFDAVDHDATVLVNGTVVAQHAGGYDAFSADVTDALRTGTNEIVVRVSDTTGLTPKGKQSQNPSGIFYTPASGIWQTVWMEPVAAASIDAVVTTPVLTDDGDSLDVTVKSTSAGKNAKVELAVRDKAGKVVARKDANVGATTRLALGKSHRWTPDTPYLYGVEAKLTQAGRTDKVASYAGIRSIGIEKIDGVNRVVLNGKRTYLNSTLDQGYWPDGVYTAPTDEALAWDIQETKDLGFNTIRKHIKVESPRWYHHADEIGMLVWQDMPAAFTGRNAESTSKAVTDQWEKELHAMIDQLRSVPSVIGWIPFNEGWSEWDLDATARVAADIKKDDPTRLLNTHSGVNCCQSLGDSHTGDILDHHAYTGPASPNPDATRAAIDGEHGGFSLSVRGHVWPGGSVNPYGEVDSSAALTKAYVENTSRLVGLAREKLSGSVYTQITDLEGEVNGFWTYDRRISKMDRAAVRAVNLKVQAAGDGEPSPDPVRDPLAGWDLDSVSGTSTPGVTGSPDATIGGGAALTAGVHGQALALDGTDDQASATVDGFDTTGSYSVSAWARLDALPSAYATVVGSKGLSGRSPFFLQYSGIAKGFAMSFPDGPRAISPTPAQVGQWYHLVGVRDVAAGTLSLYVDGAKVASESTAGTPQTSGVVTVGRGQWDGAAVDFLHGAVDEVRVFGRALSADEIGALATR